MSGRIRVLVYRPVLAIRGHVVLRRYPHSAPITEVRLAAVIYARKSVDVALSINQTDASFYAYQMLEAGVRQFDIWGNTDEGRHVLVVLARYLAAHSPTERTSDYYFACLLILDKLGYVSSVVILPERARFSRIRGRVLDSVFRYSGA